MEESSHQSSSSRSNPQQHGSLKRHHSEMSSPSKEQKQKGDNDNNSNNNTKNSESEQESDLHQQKYHTNQKVFARDSNQVYHANIKKVRLKSTTPRNRRKQIHDAPMQIPSTLPQWEYHVHFQGWSARHDRWLTSTDIRPDDDAEWRELAIRSKQKLADLEEEKKKKKLLEKEKKEQKKRDLLAKKQQQKKKKEETEELQVVQEERIVWSFEEWCTLPFTLRTVLIDDQNRITRLGHVIPNRYDSLQDFQRGITTSSSDVGGNKGWIPPRMVHELPASNNVRVILKQFVKKKKKKQDDNNGDGEPITTEEKEQKNMEENLKFVKEMMVLFDIMLPKYLLYKQERAQYLMLAQNEEKNQKEPDNSHVTKNGEGEKTNNGIIHSNSNSKSTTGDAFPFIPSRVYGGEFLLRMLVRLPIVFKSLENASNEIHDASNTDDKTNDYNNNHMYQILMKWGKANEQQNQTLGKQIADLIVFLQKNKRACFKEKYRSPCRERGEWTEDEKGFADKLSCG